MKVEVTSVNMERGEEGDVPDAAGNARRRQAEELPVGSGWSPVTWRRELGRPAGMKPAGNLRFLASEEHLRSSSVLCQ